MRYVLRVNMYKQKLGGYILYILRVIIIYLIYFHGNKERQAEWCGGDGVHVNSKQTHQV